MKPATITGGSSEALEASGGGDRGSQNVADIPQEEVQVDFTTPTDPQPTASTEGISAGTSTTTTTTPNASDTTSSATTTSSRRPLISRSLSFSEQLRRAKEIGLAHTIGESPGSGKPRLVLDIDHTTKQSASSTVTNTDKASKSSNSTPQPNPSTPQNPSTILPSPSKPNPPPPPPKTPENEHLRTNPSSSDEDYVTDNPTSPQPKQSQAPPSNPATTSSQPPIQKPFTVNFPTFAHMDDDPEDQTPKNIFSPGANFNPNQSFPDMNDYRRATLAHQDRLDAARRRTLALQDIEDAKRREDEAFRFQQYAEERQQEQEEQQAMMQEQLDNMRQEYENDIRSYKERIAKLVAQEVRLLAAVTELRQNVSDLQEQTRQNLSQQNKDLMSMKDLQTQSTKYEYTIATLRDDIHKHKSTIEQLEAKLQKFNSQKDTTISANLQLQKSLSSANEQIKNLKDSNSTMEADLAQYAQDIVDLQEAYKEASDKIIAYQAKETEHAQTVRELRQHYRAQQHSMHALREHNDDVTKANTQLTNSLQNTKQELHQTLQELKDHQSTIAQLRRDNTDLKHQLKDAQALLEVTQQRHDDELTSLSAELNEVIRTNHNQQQQIKKYKQELRDATSRINNLEQRIDNMDKSANSFSRTIFPNDSAILDTPHINQKNTQQKAPFMPNDDQIKLMAQLTQIINRFNKNEEEIQEQQPPPSYLCDIRASLGQYINSLIKQLHDTGVPTSKLPKEVNLEMEHQTKSYSHFGTWQLPQYLKQQAPHQNPNQPQPVNAPPAAAANQEPPPPSQIPQPPKSFIPPPADPTGQPSTATGYQYSNQYQTNPTAPPQAQAQQFPNIPPTIQAAPQNPNQQSAHHHTHFLPPYLRNQFAYLSPSYHKSKTTTTPQGPPYPPAGQATQQMYPPFVQNTSSFNIGQIPDKTRFPPMSLPHFNGTTPTIETWINQINNAAINGQWSDYQTCSTALAYLKGEAAEWWNTHTQCHAPFTAWDGPGGLLQALVTRFAKVRTHNDVSRAIRDLKQRSDETVLQFHDRVCQAIKWRQQMDNPSFASPQHQQQHFNINVLNALRDGISTRIMDYINQSLTDPSTSEAFMDMARKAEEIINDSRKIKGTSAITSAASASDNRPDISSFSKCYRCNQPGHFARECPNVESASTRQARSTSRGRSTSKQRRSRSSSRSRSPSQRRSKQKSQSRSRSRSRGRPKSRQSRSSKSKSRSSSRKSAQEISTAAITSNQHNEIWDSIPSDDEEYFH